jgi:3-deoxy-D-manno-octulosonic-acid transferase
MYWLYSALLASALVLAGPYWLYEMLRHGKYRHRVMQRFGAVPAAMRNPARRAIWIHAVSVGEVLAVSELVRRLAAEFPNHRILASTTTDTGQKLAAKLFGPENVFYFPLDFGFAVRRWMTALRPELIVVAETEFWPNFLRVARECGSRIAVVNARISDRSLPGYRRWRKILRRVLSGVGLFLAQTPQDARRLIEIGAPADRVFAAGNLKYDVQTPAAAPIVDKLRAALSDSGAGPIMVCGSTVEGEEELLLRAFQQIAAKYPALVMLLAPRHPQRFDQVAVIIARSGVRAWRRSKWEGEAIRGGVLLIDSIGELSSLYALADIAFVGGSLVPRGGHNIIEPTQYGVPVLVGPHTENFRDIISLFQANNAVRVIEPAGLAGEVMRLLAIESERRDMGHRAAETLRSDKTHEATLA